MIDRLQAVFSDVVVAGLSRVVFFDVVFWDRPGDAGVTIPLVVLWLVIGATFFTLRFNFANVRLFRHAIDCVRGAYTRPDEYGEISHFQALSAALSATVGLGNIAGVAVAVGLGGPGAVFWMVMAGLLGMSSKFAECTLGQRYRILHPDGHVMGGPMIYLKDGLAELGLPRLGRVLAVAFAFLCIGGSLGGGNMFQSNQSYEQVSSVLPFFEGRAGAVAFGGAMVASVALVIVGGIRRIGEVAGVLVPVMCALYVISGLTILALHAGGVGDAFGTIVGEAFNPRSAAVGGLIGVLVQGFRRAAFSNEAGIGSAPIAHSAAATDEPVREGIVALLEPFIDTVVVCTTTGLVIVVTGAHLAPDVQGIGMTSLAFESVFPWFPVVLSVTAVLFAYSTMISWSYYGERSWESLFGQRRTILFKVLFLTFTWLGALFPMASVVEFSDLMLLGMAFPNLAGVMLLSGLVRRDLDDYVMRLRSGAFRRRDDP